MPSSSIYLSEAAVPKQPRLLCYQRNVTEAAGQAADSKSTHSGNYVYGSLTV